MLTSCSPDKLAELQKLLRENAYPGYVYGYPHKKAYRPLDPPRSLAEVWRDEDRSSLFCYVHIPFCNQRCSFCNLFTYVPGSASPSADYVEALHREMESIAQTLAPLRFRRLYLGGGTPTFLTTAELRRLVRQLRSTLDIDPAQTHGCIECSPETLDAEKVFALRELGFARISLGVQSFHEEELRQVNRRFDPRLQTQTIQLIGQAGFPHFNIDLIYGLPGQNLASWRDSLTKAIDTPATSVFLYPLYIRPLTGLAVRASCETLTSPTSHEMGAMYDLARLKLSNAGFRQNTMRQFRRDVAVKEDPALEYVCQRHGTVGLGAGARSYTTGHHYCTPWRMVTRNIRAVVDDYVARMRAGDSLVTHGVVLDDEERRRRYVIQSLLFDGLGHAAFKEEFARDARDLFAEEWSALAAEGLIEGGDVVRLTARGVRHADIVGQVFFSDAVKTLVAQFEYDS